MSALIKKAQAGQKKAMEALYEQNKVKVYFVAKSLLEDDKAANVATVQAFKTAFNDMGKLSFADEKEFSDYTVKCVADACKKTVLKKNSRAYQLPAGKNFSIVNPKSAYEVTENHVDFVFNQFNDLQKLIFVLHTAGGCDDRALSLVTKFDKKTVELALAAEKENVEHIVCGALTYSAICESFIRKSGEITVPKAVDEAVSQISADIALPIASAKKKRITTIILIALAVCIVGFGIYWLATRTDDSEKPSDGNEVSDYVIPDKSNIEVTKTTIEDGVTYYADIDVRDHGVITIKLDPSQAPKTVQNFVSLANSGFYDGLTFHRIMEGFMMQGGAPAGNGSGGYKEKIYGEFTANGVQNTISHKRGVVSMARANAYNSGSSQFFIVHQDSTFLDGNYAAFGYVTEGMDIVDTICENARPTDNNGTIPLQKQPIMNKVTIRTEGTPTNSTDSSKDESDDTSDETSEDVQLSIDMAKTYYANIEIKDFGNITIKLDQNQAPITVDNFVSLAKSGFYDGLTFHRIMEGFMMQGGDPAGNGTGGSDKNIVGEFSANGKQNNISHKRGVISMARATPYNSASSQFFIVHQDSTFLDGQYAGFGYVTEGMDVVDSICESAQPTDNNGTISKDQQPVITKITITEE